MARAIETPTDLTATEARQDLSRIPRETRHKAAMQLLRHDMVDGWEALAPAIFGRRLEFGERETHRATS
jgi:hypothetical protein